MFGIDNIRPFVFLNRNASFYVKLAPCNFSTSAFYSIKKNGSRRVLKIKGAHPKVHPSRESYIMITVATTQATGGC